MDYIESDCTIAHEGHEYTSGGAIVTDEYCIAYPSKKTTGNMRRVGWLTVSEHVLNDWHGKQVGVWWNVSVRPAIFFGRQSWMGSKWHYIRAIVDGKQYALRGFGDGMVARGKRIKGT